MAKEPFDQDLDALLQDLHHMLGDAPPAPPEDGLEDLDLSHLDLETPTAPIAASDVEIDYARFYDEPMPEPDPELAAQKKAGGGLPGAGAAAQAQ